MLCDGYEQTKAAAGSSSSSSNTRRGSQELDTQLSAAQLKLLANTALPRAAGTTTPKRAGGSAGRRRGSVDTGSAYK